MKKYFLPRGEKPRAMWLSNFAAKIGTYAIKYNISSGEVNDMVAASKYQMYWMGAKLQYDDFKKGVTAYNRELNEGIRSGSAPSLEPVPPTLGAPPPAVPPGIFARATSIANRIKDHYNYTEADGNDLGLEGPESSVDFSRLKPVLKIVVVAGVPEIAFVKGRLTGVELYVKRSESEPFVMLSIAHSSPFKDKHPLPPPGQTTIWKYRAVYRLKDQQVGHWSDEVSVVVVG